MYKKNLLGLNTNVGFARSRHLHPAPPGTTTACSRWCLLIRSDKVTQVSTVDDHWHDQYGGSASAQKLSIELKKKKIEYPVGNPLRRTMMTKTQPLMTEVDYSILTDLWILFWKIFFFLCVTNCSCLSTFFDLRFICW